jgi:hypothetical protein
MSAPSPVVRLVAVGSSAGCIEALSAFVIGLSANFPIKQDDRMQLPPPQDRATPTRLRRAAPAPRSATSQLARIRREMLQGQARHDDAEGLLLRLPIGVAVVDLQL